MPVTILDSRPAGPVTRRATVLFVDLRGYTGLAERVPPADLVPMLDEFFGLLVGTVEYHAGEVFHVAGDGMLAGFGLEPGRAQPAASAMAAAREMQDRFEDLGARWKARLVLETGIGVGIHEGEVARALLGPPGRLTSTLLGDTVNVAARLCARARAGEILFSAAVAAALRETGADPDRLDGHADCRRLPAFAVRGRVEPLDIWCVPAPERRIV
jgi:adenylate cyclase